jgi:hypothetical protein
MSEPVDVIATADFTEARELAAVLKELLLTGRHISSLGRDDIVYVVAPDGRVCHCVRLVKERLTDGSFTFNIHLS